ncbi:hypothetical protein ACGVWS_10900 [Enterobacteriaceae bacterium LUAb1]
MATKTFYYSQFAYLRVEGVGPHASYSINLNIKDENVSDGKSVYISASGKSNAAKAAGSGSVIFWCTVKVMMNNAFYKLDRQRGESFAVGLDEILIGSTQFKIQREGLSSPKIEIEAGYFYDSGYTGHAVPFPGSMKRIITLTPFGSD